MKDIRGIIQFIDNYLTRTGQSYVDPVEANKLLAKAGLLKDSQDRRGKPLRELLRKGLLPHAYQNGGEGSNWVIPKSGSIKPQTFTEPKKLTKQNPGAEELPTKIVVPKKSSPFTGVNDIEEKLMATKNLRQAGEVDLLVPDVAGLYCIRIKQEDKLPPPFDKVLKSRNHNIIYIGIATQSLKKRFLHQELRAKGHGTFFRTIGAVLGYLPEKGSLITKANKRNYTFRSSDEKKIIEWMNNHLLVNWVTFNGEFEIVESSLIQKHLPLLNLAKNPAALAELSSLRARCVRIANGIEN